MTDWLDRFSLWRMDWFPYRVSEYRGYDDDAGEFIWGETHWMPPRFGPLRWLWRLRRA
jgi:hypothetical protein